MRWLALCALIAPAALVGCEGEDTDFEGELTTAQIRSIQPGNAVSNVFGGRWDVVGVVAASDCTTDALPALGQSVTDQIPILQSGGSLTSNVDDVTFKGSANEDGSVLFGRYWTNSDGIQVLELVDGDMTLKSEMGAELEGTWKRRYVGDSVDCTISGDITGETDGDTSTMTGG